MTDNKTRSKEQTDEFKELRDLWHVLRSIHAEKGIDTVEVGNVWAGAIRDSFSRWASEKSLDELCRAGCSPIALALAFRLGDLAVSLVGKWKASVGSTRRRNQTIRALKKAADILGNLMKSFANAIVKDTEGILSPKPQEQLRDWIVTGQNAEWPKNAPAPHPATTIRALRFYASTLQMFESLPKEMQGVSSYTVPKYLISAYVKRATGNFHDAHVSALIGSALGKVYDETTHRVWRSRNYKQLDKHLGWLAEILFGIGVVAVR